MKRIKVVIGSNFGDEGKGLMTDYFCSELSADGPVLNVRFNGGAQAGHTVTTPEGKRHVFQHIGAGHFVPEVSTYLSPFFIVNPILFHREYERFATLGDTPRIFVDENCPITLPQDMMINQILEKSRKGANHGSCGVGIFETVTRTKNQRFKITAKDCTNRRLLKDMMLNIIENYVPQRLSSLGVDPSSEETQLLHDTGIVEAYLDDSELFWERAALAAGSDILNQYPSLVFEGAQGLLLDQDNMDLFPHLTPSNTGLKNPAHILKQIDNPYRIEVCYVTRSYFTRHGAGPMASACEKDAINPTMEDQTNVTNEFQGAFRYGYFDYDLFCQTIRKDYGTYSPSLKNVSMSICVTHLNETKGMLACQNSPRPAASLAETGPAKIYGSDGLTRNSVNMIA